MLLGGGGHAVVVAEAARDAGWRIAGFFDDNARAEIGGLGPRLGTLAEARAAYASMAEGAFIVAVGGIELRRRLIDEAAACGSAGRFVTVVHPSSAVSRLARVGAGVYVGAGAVINARAVIGDHAIINTGAIVEHDCNVGANVHVAPGAVLGGGTKVGADTLIGIRACTIPLISIGAGCTVGAGAALVRDVGEGVTVVGVPGRGMATKAT